MRGSKVFTVMVVGDKPDELMSKYEQGTKVEPYKVYSYSNAENMRANSISILKEIIKNPKKFNLNEFHSDYLKDRLNSIKSMTPFEYYSDIVNGYKIDDNGDAWSDINKNGKWQTYQLGDNFSTPLKLKDGSETNQALNRDIDWNSMHLVNTKVFDLAWDLVHNIKSPSNEEEANIYKNMKDKTEYFSNFKNKDAYISHCCAYWNYAYLDKNGWVDIDDSKNNNDWVTNFFDTFVTKLKENDKVTIFECTKDKDVNIN